MTPTASSRNTLIGRLPKVRGPGDTARARTGPDSLFAGPAGLLSLPRASGQGREPDGRGPGITRAAGIPVFPFPFEGVGAISFGWRSALRTFGRGSVARNGGVWRNRRKTR